MPAIADQSDLFFWCLGVFALSILGLVLVFPARGRRPVLAAACLFCLSFGFSIAIAEYFLPCMVSSTALTTRQYLRYQADDAFIRFKWLPGSAWKFVWPEFNIRVKINSQGLRGPKSFYENPLARPRIMMIGDSFTFGFGVEQQDSYCGIIRNKLGKDFDVINTGVTGYGPLYELMYFLLEGHKYKPDAVFVFIHPGDLNDTIYLLKNFFDANGLRISMIMELARASGYQYTDHAPRNRIRVSNIELAFSQMLNKIRGHGSDGIRTIKLGLSSICVFMKQPPLLSKRREIMNLKLIGQLIDLCQDMGIEINLVMIPCWAQIHEQDWQATLKKTGLPATDFDMDLPQSAIGDLARKKKASLLDLLPVFAREGKQRRLYFHHDEHINPEGHKLVAKAFLAEFEEGLRQTCSDRTHGNK